MRWCALTVFIVQDCLFIAVILLWYDTVRTLLCCGIIGFLLKVLVELLVVVFIIVALHTTTDNTNLHIVNCANTCEMQLQTKQPMVFALQTSNRLLILLLYYADLSNQKLWIFKSRFSFAIGIDNIYSEAAVLLSKSVLLQIVPLKPVRHIYSNASWTSHAEYGEMNCCNPNAAWALFGIIGGPERNPKNRNQNPV